MSYFCAHCSSCYFKSLLILNMPVEIQCFSFFLEQCDSFADNEIKYLENGCTPEIIS